jgi:hypothetical protein
MRRKFLIEAGMTMARDYVREDIRALVIEATALDQGSGSLSFGAVLAPDRRGAPISDIDLLAALDRYPIHSLQLGQSIGK